MSQASIPIWRALEAWQLVLLLLLVGFAGASTVPAVSLPVLLQEEDENGDDEDDEDDAPAPKPQQPAKPIVQSGALEGETRFKSVEEEPYFMVQIPKKPKGLRDQWVFIDVDERLEAELEDVNRAIEIEDEKEGTQDHEPRMQALKDKKSRIERHYQKVPVILEVWKETPRPGAVQRIRVIVDRASIDQKVAAVAYKDSWTSITKIRDEETTSKRERKNNRFTYFYECLGTDKNLGPCWGRFVTCLLYSNKGTTRYKVDYVHWAKIDEYNADKKAFRKAADALWNKFKLP